MPIGTGLALAVAHGLAGIPYGFILFFSQCLTLIENLLFFLKVSSGTTQMCSKIKMNSIWLKMPFFCVAEKTADDEVQKSDISSSSQGMIEKESLGPLLLEVCAMELAAPFILENSILLYL